MGRKPKSTAAKAAMKVMKTEKRQAARQEAGANESGDTAVSRGGAAATGVNKEEPSASQDNDDCDAAKGAGDSQCEVDAKDKQLRKQDAKAPPRALPYFLCHERREILRPSIKQ